MINNLDYPRSRAHDEWFKIRMILYQYVVTSRRLASRLTSIQSSYFLARFTYVCGSSDFSYVAIKP
jgi:hypothetical protein